MAGRQNIVSARRRQTATGIERYEEVCAENADNLKRKIMPEPHDIKKTIEIQVCI